MRIFVTGSTGFIGSHFLRAALDAGHEVIALRYPGSQSVIPIPESDRVTWIDGDLNSFLTDLSVCQRFSISASPPALVHLAAYGVSPQPCTWKKAFEINVTDSLSLIERAIDRGISRVILCGTCMEYGTSAERYEFIPSDAPLEPVGPYATSKAALSMAATALCTERGTPLSILRLFTVYGEGQHPSNLWPSLRKAALAGENFPMSPGEQVRDFVPVEQVAQAFLHALDVSTFHFPPSAFPKVANVGTGHPQTILAFAHHWWKEWEAKGKLLPGALPYRENEVMRYVPEISEIFKP